MCGGLVFTSAGNMAAQAHTTIANISVSELNYMQHKKTLVKLREERRDSKVGGERPRWREGN